VESSKEGKHLLEISMRFLKPEGMPSQQRRRKLLQGKDSSTPMQPKEQQCTGHKVLCRSTSARETRSCLREGTRLGNQ